MAGDQILNELSDTDDLWGPLVFLRPARDQRFTSLRLLLVCASYGVFYGMCANMVFALTHHYGGRFTPPFYGPPLFLTLTSFICGQLTFIQAWNRRVRQLERRLAWSRATEGGRQRVTSTEC